MSHAITALLLLQLDRVPGEWVAVHAMATHLSLARPVVCDHLLPLSATGQVWLRRDATGLIEAARAQPGDCARHPEPAPQAGPAARPPLSDPQPFKPHTPYPVVPNIPAALIQARRPILPGWWDPCLWGAATEPHFNPPAKEPAHDFTR